MGRIPYPTIAYRTEPSDVPVTMPSGALVLAQRAVHGERTLRRELPGYEAYATRTRYRFIPLVWEDVIRVL
jgi:hypothetical protein